MQHHRHLRRHLATGAALAALCTNGATAQIAGGTGPQGASSSGEIEQIVVTATKRTESSQSVPFGLSALSEEDLAARGAQSVEQALQFIPSVNFSSNGTNAGALSIRGVSTSSSVANAQSPVALYIDDINVLDPTYPKVSTNLRLFDVSRVEVLEGPQGTLFGSGSLGGAVRVITNKPDLDRIQAATEDTVQGTEGGGVGDDLNAMVNVPIIDGKLAVRAVGYFQQEAGYIDNTAIGVSNVNHAISEGARIEVKWAPTEAFSLVGTVLLEDDRPHDSSYSFYNSTAYKWNGLVPNTNYNNTKIYSLDAVYDFSSFNVTSITTFADRQENVAADFSSNAALLTGLDTASSISDAGPSRTFSEEVRLASTNTDKFRWLVGAIYIDNRKTDDENVLIPGSQALTGSSSDDVSIANSNTRITEAALFGEASYEVLPALTLTLGGRLFRDELVINQVIGGTVEPPGTEFSRTHESAFTPKINLSYKFGENQMAYVQATEGYRVGQVNPVPRDPISGQAIPVASHPDKLWNYEIGEKGTYFDGHLQLNASAYYIDWNKIQLDALTQGAQINYIANAGEAHIYGGELSVIAKPWKRWEFGLSASLNDSRVDSVAQGVSALVGDRLPGFAPESFDGYVQYNYPIGDDSAAFVRVDGRYLGKEYADLDNPTSLVYGNYGNLNLRTGIDWDRYTVTLFVNNLTNSDGKTSAFPSFNVPVAIRQVPLTAGVTVDARF